MCERIGQTMQSIPHICSLYYKLLSYSLEESGSTALGPALIISIAMAARVSGSRVSSVFTRLNPGLRMYISTKGCCVH